MLTFNLGDIIVSKVVFVNNNKYIKFCRSALTRFDSKTLPLSKTLALVRLKNIFFLYVQPKYICGGHSKTLPLSIKKLWYRSKITSAGLRVVSMLSRRLSSFFRASFDVSPVLMPSILLLLLCWCGIGPPTVCLEPLWDFVRGFKFNEFQLFDQT